MRWMREASVPLGLDTSGAKCHLLIMGQPVNISDQLVRDARLASGLADRSIAGQIGFWAKLGRAIEPLLTGTQVLALRRAGEVKPLSACIETVDSPEGRRLVGEYLNAQPFPHYEPALAAWGCWFALKPTASVRLGGSSLADSRPPVEEMPLARRTVHHRGRRRTEGLRQDCFAATLFRGSLLTGAKLWPNFGTEVIQP